MGQSRRTFIGKSLGLAAAAGLAGAIPAGLGLSSCGRRAGASDRVRVALIGCRNMGFTNICGFIRQPDVDLVALCDIDQNILESRNADIQKYAYEQQVEIPKPELYRDFRKVLQRRDVDAVIVATPDHWHALMTILACQAGKDVYVEKPVANSIFEADQMVKAADRYHSVVQCGQWQRSGIHWKELTEFIQAGSLGSISRIDVWRYGGNEVPVVPDGPVPAGVDYDLWLGPAPKKPFNQNRFHYNFRWFWDYAGGKMTDWGVHLLDMAIWALDLEHPTTVSASGGKFVFPDDAMETPDKLIVNYRFGPVEVVWENNFGLQTTPFGFDHGLTFHGENGIIRANRSFWEVYPAEADGKPAIDPVPRNANAGNDLALHIREFLDAIKTRNRATAASIQVGRNAARVAHMGNIAYRTGLELHWDGEARRFNESEANRYLQPEYRKPWELPKI
ncbi:MAG: Gfo/Idh/MocA family oxidoreductase [Bacteroidales bacterium]